MSERVPSLESILSNFSLLDDIEDIIGKLHLIMTEGHIYQEQWQTLALNKSMFEKVGMIVSFYDANHLLVFGYSVRLLAMMTSLCEDNVVIRDVFSPTFTETLLKIAIKSPLVYGSCFQIFDNLLVADSKYFNVILEKGLDVVDYFITSRIKYQNFVSIFDFVLRNVTISEPELFTLGLTLLIKYIPFVEVQHLANYFISKYAELFLQAVQSDHASLKAIIIKFLKELIPLHNSHATEMWKMGLIDRVLDLIETFPSDSPIELICDYYGFMIMSCCNYFIRDRVGQRLDINAFRERLQGIDDIRILSYMTELFHLLFLRDRLELTTNTRNFNQQGTRSEHEASIVECIGLIMNGVLKGLQHSVDVTAAGGMADLNIVEEVNATDHLLIGDPVLHQTLRCVANIISNLNLSINICDIYPLQSIIDDIVKVLIRITSLDISGENETLRNFSDDFVSLHMKTVVFISDVLKNLCGIKISLWSIPDAGIPSQLILDAADISPTVQSVLISGRQQHRAVIGTAEDIQTQTSCRDSKQSSESYITRPFKSDQHSTNSNSKSIPLTINSLEGSPKQSVDANYESRNGSSSLPVHGIDGSSPNLRIFGSECSLFGRNGDSTAGSIAEQDYREFFYRNLSNLCKVSSRPEKQSAPSRLLRERIIKIFKESVGDAHSSIVKHSDIGSIPFKTLCMNLIKILLIANLGGLTQVMEVLDCNLLCGKIGYFFGKKEAGPTIPTSGLQSQSISLATALNLKSNVPFTDILLSTSIRLISLFVAEYPTSLKVSPSVQEFCMSFLLKFKRTPCLSVDIHAGFSFRLNKLHLQGVSGFKLYEEEQLISSMHYLYQVLELLIALAKIDRNLRRQIVKNFASMATVLDSTCSYHSTIPLLHLLHSALEWLPKLDENSEEHVVSLIIKIMRSQSRSLKLFGCQLIGDIGDVHPGLIYRGLGRREVEDLLIKMLRSESQPKKLCFIIRACTTCVKDINPKPVWIYNSWLYHWKDYEGGLSDRPLLQLEVVETIAERMVCGSGIYVLPLFAQGLAFTTSLMYNCTDGVIASNRRTSEANGSNALRSELVATILPLIPRSLDVITHRRGVLIKSYPVGGFDSTEIGYNLIIPDQSITTAGRSVLSQDTEVINPEAEMEHDIAARRALNFVDDSAFMNMHGEKHDASHRITDVLKYSNPFKSFSSPKKRFISGPGSPATGANMAPKVEKLHGLLPFLSTGSEPQPQDQLNKLNASGNNAAQSYLLDGPDSQMRNSAIEVLAEKTVDAIFSFLCLEEMFPMSTYLRNIELFDRVPIIACIACTMNRFPENLIIQKRGIDVFKCFANNQIELSAIAMHGPPAMLTSIKLCGSESEYQITFSKIITVLASTDEFVRENILRFGIQESLLDMFTNRSMETIVQSCIAISNLAQSPDNVNMLCSRHPVLDSVIKLMESHTTNKRIQVEGLRILVALSNSYEQWSMMLSHPNALIVMKKTKKYIQELIKADKLFPEYEKEDIEPLLSSNIAREDKCSVA